MSSQRIQLVQEYYFSSKLREIDKMRQEGRHIINLGIGSPDLPPHPSVIDTLSQIASKPTSHGYSSYKGIPGFRKAIADFYSNYYQTGLDPDLEILPLMGSKEGIMHLCMAYLDPGDHAWIPNPGYPTYAAAVKLAGGIPVAYELKEDLNWQISLEELEIQWQQGIRPKMIWVNYPHMPTGAKGDISTLTHLIQFAREKNILICHDNPYSFILNDHPFSLLSLPDAKECCVELNSLSKSHNMAGWRVGMLCGQADAIQNALRFKSNMDSGMFVAVQEAAIQALQLDWSWFQSLNAIYRDRRNQLMVIMDHLQCTYDPEQIGLFLWGKVKEGNGYALSDQCLYESGVFITPGGIFGTGGDAYIRLSLCQPVVIIQEAIQQLQAIKI
jgi:LL-diaminopimelate aminotransferase